ncbi:MAG: hypothetical protein HOL98_06935 [Gammaproteobacteria bacterium]|nr:hypothetical protein [Gammaproteobacteria bacterium]MBT5203172.1 hypothetical protein [Gammaproteobacteria bacterium]MBT5601500.1 hypothetical protein [Gammaproteobacteria bacterium]MBT6244083.1 hypothetical protein [Gammaproteobacteria bacterium]
MEERLDLALNESNSPSIDVTHFGGVPGRECEDGWVWFECSGLGGDRIKPEI